MFCILTQAKVYIHYRMFSRSYTSVSYWQMCKYLLWDTEGEPTIVLEVLWLLENCDDSFGPRRALCDVKNTIQLFITSVAALCTMLITGYRTFSCSLAGLSICLSICLSISLTGLPPTRTPSRHSARAAAGQKCLSNAVFHSSPPAPGKK